MKGTVWSLISTESLPRLCFFLLLQKYCLYLTQVRSIVFNWRLMKNIIFWWLIKKSPQTPSIRKNHSSFYARQQIEM